MTLSDWKSLSITQEFLAVFKNRINEQMEQLALSAGVDTRMDSFRAGAIAAMNDMVNFELEESHN